MTEKTVIRFELEDPKSGESQIVEPEFETKEIAVLQCFLDEAIALRSCGPVVSPPKVSCNLSVSVEAGMNANAVLPTDDEISILLMKLRPFLLKKEQTAFYKVCNILKRRIRVELFDKMLDKQKNRWAGSESRSVFTIRRNDDVVNCDKYLMAWVNSDHYHRDPLKKEEIKLLRAGFTDEFMETVFWFLLIGKVNAVGSIAGVISVILNKGVEELSL